MTMTLTDALMPPHVGEPVDHIAAGGEAQKLAGCRQAAAEIGTRLQPTEVQLHGRELKEILAAFQQRSAHILADPNLIIHRYSSSW